MIDTGPEAGDDEAGDAEVDATGAVVVGVDGSDQSLQALRWGAREARVRDTTVVAGMAYSYLDQRHAGDSSFDPAYDRDDARRALDSFVARAGVDGEVPIRTQVACDRPGHFLVEISRTAALLVVGRRGLGYLREAVVGSTSHHCLRHADCPLVVTPDAPGHGGAAFARRVVVGVHDWDSYAALRWAVDTGVRHQLPVEAVHVRWPHTPPVGDFMFGDDEEVQDRDARELFDAMLSAVDTSALPAAVRRTVVADAPVPTLLDRSASGDLVVVGAPPARRRRVTPMWVPERLVHHASSPIVIVPAASDGAA
jgi:nucleotide-binding universal stress UspA family protein